MAGGGGHAWQGVCMAGGMCGRGVCVARVCARHGACMARGVHGGGGMCGGGVCVARGGGGAWQERRPLQRTVGTLLEYILVSLYIDGTIFFPCRAE